MWRAENNDRNINYWLNKSVDVYVLGTFNPNTSNLMLEAQLPLIPGIHSASVTPTQLHIMVDPGIVILDYVKNPNNPKHWDILAMPTPEVINQHSTVEDLLYKPITLADLKEAQAKMDALRPDPEVIKEEKKQAFIKLLGSTKANDVSAVIERIEKDGLPTDITCNPDDWYVMKACFGDNCRVHESKDIASGNLQFMWLPELEDKQDLKIEY